MDSDLRATTMDNRTAATEPTAGCSAQTADPPQIEATAAAVLAAARASVLQPGPAQSADDDDFQPQGHRKRPRREAQSEVAATSTSNRFSALEDDDDMFNNDPAAASQQHRPPPIVIRNKTKWVSIAAHISACKLNFTKARALQDGIQIQPATKEDFRGITRILDNGKEEYHTFLMPEEKPLRVVIRGIDPAIAIEDLQDFFSVSDLPVNNVRRMTGKDGTPLKLVMVTLDRTPEAKAIFKLKTILHLPITVESPNRKVGQVSQCHKCQRFNHSQRGCHAKSRCVKCGGEHHTATCQKKKEENPKCCNCGGQHPASYRGCTAFPRTRRPQNTPRPAPAPRAAHPAPAARPTPAPPTNLSAWPALPTRQPTSQQTPPIPAPNVTIPAPPPKIPIPNNNPSGPFDILQLLKLLSTINIQRLVAVSRKVIAALSSATTPEGTLAALLSIAADIYSLFQP